MTDLRDDVDLWVLPELESERYLAGFAGSRAVVEQALRLRYEVFNLELQEGLPESHLTGLDRDQFDDQMTHLVVIDKLSHQVVGTYRLQVAARALRHAGLYCAQEFELAPLAALMPQAVECGRACVSEDHRTLPVLLLLWKGLAAFKLLHGCPILFGCCSLTSQNPEDGWRAMKTLRAGGMLHPEMAVHPVAAYSCGDPARECDPAVAPIRLPKLFAAYMRLGIKVVSLPAIDRDFGTVDFLVMMDSRHIDLEELAANLMAQFGGRLKGVNG